VAEKLAAMQTKTFFRERRARADMAAFRRILDRSGGEAPWEDDRIAGQLGVGCEPEGRREQLRPGPGSADRSLRVRRTAVIASPCEAIHGRARVDCFARARNNGGLGWVFGQRGVRRQTRHLPERYAAENDIVAVAA
jgi:hypothetical protein